MPVEGLKIVIGADVNSAVQPLQKVTKSLQDVENQLADTLASGDDFAKALDDIVKEGNIAGGVINFLQKEINDFKNAFASATTTEDIQKFGAALQILQDKQNQVIQSGLKAGDSLDHIGKHSSGNVVATQRLSSALLGMNKIFDILPEEIAHSTHGFDQLIQGFERVTHGTEGAGEKVLKFAEVLGEVGLGIAISVAVGLLVDFVKELNSTEHALGDAAVASAEFSERIKEQNDSIEEFKKNAQFLNEISKLRIDIRAEEETAGLSDAAKAVENLKFALLDLRGVSVQNREFISKLEQDEVDANRTAAEALKRFHDQASDNIIELKGNLGSIEQVLAAIKSKQPVTNKNGVLLSTESTELDKELLEDVKKTSEQLLKVQKDIVAANEAQTLIYGKIEKQKLDIVEEANKETRKLFDSRAAIIEEFTGKFAAIQLPLPFKKQELDLLPLGKVNDKKLRAGLQAAFNIFEPAWKSNIRAMQGIIDKDVLPVFPELRVDFKNTSQVVQDIQNQFGEIKKEVEDAVNKGIFEVPIDFRFSEGGDGQALKTLEDRINKFVADVEALSGQKKAIFDIDAEFLANLNDKSAADALEEMRKQLQSFADGTPIDFKVTAKGEVKPEVDEKRLQEELSKAIANAIADAGSQLGEGIGNILGDALSGNGLEDAFGSLISIIADGMATIGKALVKAGILATGIQNVIDKLGLQPGLAIALGVAMIALSKALHNSFAGGARASGGTIMPGETYRVNEQGREMFVPAGGQPQWLGENQEYFTAPKAGKILPAWLAKQIAVKMNFPALAGGGAATGPTFALIGEGFGISANNPEVIAPFSSLKNLLSVNNNTEQQTKSIIRGKDLLLLHQRQNRSNGRLV